MTDVRGQSFDFKTMLLLWATGSVSNSDFFGLWAEGNEQLQSKNAQGLS